MYKYMYIYRYIYIHIYVYLAVPLRHPAFLPPSPLLCGGGCIEMRSFNRMIKK